MLLTACVLADIGYSVAWDVLFPAKSCQVVTNLPSLPFQGKQYWHEGMISKMKRFPEKSHELLGARASHIHGAWVNPLRLDIVNYLTDHCVQGMFCIYYCITNRLSGSIVFPGAGYIAMMMASSSATQNVVLEDVVFKSALVFENKEAAKKMQLTLNSPPSKNPVAVAISLQH